MRRELWACSHAHFAVRLRSHSVAAVHVTWSEPFQWRHLRIGHELRH